MARTIQDGSQVDPIDAVNPYGKVRDDSIPGVTQDGTFLNEALRNDGFIFFQKLLAETNITPNSQPDDTINGFQLSQAFNQYVSTRLAGGGVLISQNTNLPDDGGVSSYFDVAFGNGTFVAIKRDGTRKASTSTDGITWTSHLVADEGELWTGIGFGNGLFVASSDGGQIMTSPDGITWTSRTSPLAVPLRAVAYGAGVFVVIGTGTNNIITSPDGITWTQRNIVNGTWDRVIFGNGLFVVKAGSASATNVLATSPDGITWTNRTANAVPAQQSDGIFDLAFSPKSNRFIAIKSRNQPDSWAFSDDGINWTAVDPSPDSVAWARAAVIYGIFVVIANGWQATSVDGRSWRIKQNDVIGDSPQRLITGNDRIVGVTAGGLDIALVIQ